MDEAIARELELIKEGVLQVVPDTEAIYLFGSYAYGEPNKDSDLDIYVVVPDSVKENPLDVGADIRLNLWKKSRLPLDILVGTSSTFNRRKTGATIQRTVADRGVRLYG